MHRIRIERRAMVALVSAVGELDAFVASDLTSAFEDLRGESRLVLDLERVSFMDSTALGMVVRFAREVREREGEIRVVLPRGTARRIFEITALDGFLPLSPSREAAVAELATDEP